MPFGSIWRPHRRLTIGALIIILLVLGYGLVRTLTPDAPTTMTPVPVQEPFRLTRTVTLRPAHTQAVSSPVSGLIDGDVPVAGVVVREGDVLLTVLALTAPPPAPAAPAVPAPSADTAQADEWLAAGIITPAEHARLTRRTAAAPAAPAATETVPTAYPLLAPMTGRIGTVYVEAGGPLIEGSPALTVQATDPLIAALVIPPELADSVADPLAVRMSVTLETAPPQNGELAAVDTSSPGITIAKLRVANTDDALPVEADVPVTLHGNAPMTVIHLPITARIGDRSVAVVNRDGIVDRRHVTTAYTTETDWVILGGLESGDRVITDPSDRWQVGMKVEV